MLCPHPASLLVSILAPHGQGTLHLILHVHSSPQPSLCLPPPNSNKIQWLRPAAQVSSQISSKHGRDPLTCIPGRRVSIIGALYLIYSSPWLQFHVLSQDLIMLQFLHLDAKIVFKYLKLQLRKFHPDLIFLQSAVIPWMLQTWSGLRQEMGNAGAWSRIEGL